MGGGNCPFLGLFWMAKINTNLSWFTIYKYCTLNYEGVYLLNCYFHHGPQPSHFDVGVQLYNVDALCKQRFVRFEAWTEGIGKTDGVSNQRQIFWTNLQICADMVRLLSNNRHVHTYLLSDLLPRSSANQIQIMLPSVRLHVFDLRVWKGVKAKDSRSDTDIGMPIICPATDLINRVSGLICRYLQVSLGDVALVKTLQSCIFLQ